MKSVGVRELKQRTSAILRDVGRGSEVIVTVRGKPIARIVPFPNPEWAEAIRKWKESTDQLARRIAEKWPEGVSALDAVRDVRSHDYDSPRD